MRWILTLNRSKKRCWSRTTTLCRKYTASTSKNEDLRLILRIPAIKPWNWPPNKTTTAFFSTSACRTSRANPCSLPSETASGQPAHVSIIVNSAHASPSLLKRCRESGAEAVFAKPLTIEQVREALAPTRQSEKGNGSEVDGQ